jgi:hypothetical protein
VGFSKERTAGCHQAGQPRALREEAQMASLLCGHRLAAFVIWKLVGTYPQTHGQCRVQTHWGHLPPVTGSQTTVTSHIQKFSWPKVQGCPLSR